ncbi:MAG TPA: EAL domain-containing protein [Gallionella sp.]|nr:EAL domain-containing protein [Gallionella sp.]
MFKYSENAVTSSNNINKAARVLFAPAIALLNRVNYTKKFTLLWLVSLIAIAVVTHSLLDNLDRVIQPSQLQLKGIALIKPISRTIQSIQLHRGISAALLSGNETLRNRRAAMEIEAAGFFDTMEKQLPPDLAASKEFSNIKADWSRLRSNGLEWTLAENFAAHVHLLKQFFLLEQTIVDDYALILDPEINTFYLLDTALNKLPHALEHLGQLCAYGASILTSKQVSEQQKTILNTLIIELGVTLEELGVNTEKTARYNPALRDSFAAASGKIIDSARHLTGIVTSNILNGRFAMSSSTYLDVATADIKNGYAQQHEVLLPAAESLIRARITRAKQELLTSIGLSFLIFMLAVYLSVSFYYAIIGNIQSLLHSFRIFANGDCGVRINLNTRDELNQIGSGFNEMAENFGILLETRRQDEARLRATLDTAMDAVVQMDAKGIITGWNHQAEKVFGWTAEQIIGQNLSETIIPPQYREAHIKGLQHYLAFGEGTILNSRVELLGLHRNGHEFPIELSIAPILAAGKREFSAFARDITQQKESEELIWSQANYDTLTGLPNRHMFHDRLSQEIKKAHRASLKMALLFIDLDKFKEVNDTLGHKMGDLLLQEAARRISCCVREADTVARLGGDEFIIILSELDDAGNIERVAESIRLSLAEPFRLKNEVAYISASIGITLYPDDATEMEDLLKNADQAMYAAKDGGRNRFAYFTHSMQQAAQMRLRLTTELRSALAAGDQFRVYYQPIVDMATGHIHKAEALIRWQHPQRGLVSPAEFIPLAEETGLIVEIGDWVFREAAQQTARWQKLFSSGIQISVNVSPVQGLWFQTSVNISPMQFRQPGKLCKAWIDHLQELGLPGQSIAIEITEGLLLNENSDVTGKLLEFRDAGMQISIDDFGTGYSSLSYLKKFNIDYLKIDRSFVHDLATNPNDMALSEAIIVMAHKLGLKVIAEGVETEAQRVLLAQAGCDYAQGYLFSKPVSAEEFETLFNEWSPKGNSYQI